MTSPAASLQGLFDQTVNSAEPQEAIEISGTLRVVDFECLIIETGDGVEHELVNQNGALFWPDGPEHVLAARRVLAVDWQKDAIAEGYNSEETLSAGYMEMAADRQSSPRPVATNGDVERAFANADKTYSPASAKLHSRQSPQSMVPALAEEQNWRFGVTAAS